MRTRRSLMKNKLKTTSFWLGFIGAVVIILDSLSSILKVKLYSGEVQTILLSICSILVMFGFITKKKETDEKNIEKEELLEDFKDKKD